MDEFLNPKSMITPGAAGAIIMFLVNGLALPFPELPTRYVALGLSFLIATLVFSAPGLKLTVRGVFWVVNSLLIFVAAFGSANLGHQATVDHPSAQARVLIPNKLDVLHALLPVAYAQARPDEGTTAGDARKASPDAVEVEKLKREVEALRQQNEMLKKDQSQPTQADKQQFFKKW